MLAFMMNKEANQVAGDDHYDPLGLQYHTAAPTKKKRAISSSSKKRKRTKSGKRKVSPKPDFTKINDESTDSAIVRIEDAQDYPAVVPSVDNPQVNELMASLK